MKQNEIKQMSTSEKLQTMEFLWDTLRYDNVELNSPAWHVNILSERLKKIKNGQAKFISLDKLKKQSLAIETIRVAQLTRNILPLPTLKRINNI